MAKNILVIGATGFTGQRVLAELRDKGLNATSFVRKSSLKKLSEKEAVAVGDLDDVASLTKALKNKDGLIFVASMGFGHMDNVVEACEKSGIKRAVFTSSTAIFTALKVQSKDGRQAGEFSIKRSNLDWTILRPTMIYGHKGDRNMERLVTYLKKWPVLLVPGSGKALQQPVFVDDVAKAVVAAYQSENTIKRAYNISGNEAITFNDLVKTTAQMLHKKVYLIHLPLWPAVFLLHLVEKCVKNPRIKAEQLLRLNENKDFYHDQAKAHFGFAPRPFAQGIKTLIAELA